MNDAPPLDDFKVRAGCVLTTANGQEMVVEGYDEVLAMWKEAEPRDILSFTSFVNAPHLDKRLLQRYSVIAAAVYAVEEWGSEIAEMLEADRAKHNEHVAAQGAQIPGMPGFQILDFTQIHPHRPPESEGGGSGEQQ
jgi:hypothetical protein